MEESKAEFAKRGLSVAAISYDSPEILKHFAQRMGIHYPLLSDKGSAVIREFGIFNTDVPTTNQFYGIPHPGMFIVDASGKIRSKYFEKDYRERFTPETILTKEFGAAGSTQMEAKTEHLTLSVHISRDKIRPGNRVTLIVDVTLPPKMHIYAPGVQGYRPTALTIDPSSDLIIHDANFPQSKMLYLPAIKERVPVFERTVRITRDVTVSPAVKESKVNLKGTFEYQACDDKICFIPATVPLNISVSLEALDRQRVPQRD